MQELFEAIKAKNNQLALQLLNKNFNLKQKDEINGKTVLHYAIQYQNKQIIEKLLQLKDQLDLYAEDQDGMTALSQGVFQGYEEGVMLLLNNKIIDVNYIQSDEFTALMIGAAENNFQMCKILVQYGADINLVGPEGTALHYSVNEDCDDSVNFFLDLPNIDLSIQDRFDNTVIHDIIYLQKQQIFDKVIQILEQQYKQEDKQQYVQSILNIQNNVGNNIMHEAAMLDDPYYYNQLWIKAIPMGLNIKVENVNRTNPQQLKQEYDELRKKKEQEEVRKRQAESGENEETKETNTHEKFVNEWLEESKKRIQQREENGPVSYKCFGIVIFLFFICTLLLIHYILSVQTNKGSPNNNNIKF